MAEIHVCSFLNISEQGRQFKSKWISENEKNFLIEILVKPFGVYYNYNTPVLAVS